MDYNRCNMGQLLASLNGIPTMQYVQWTYFTTHILSLYYIFKRVLWGISVFKKVLLRVRPNQHKTVTFYSNITWRFTEMQRRKTQIAAYNWSA